MSLYDDAKLIAENGWMLPDTEIGRLAARAARDILRQREYAESYRERNRDHLRRKNTKRMQSVRKAAQAKAAEADPFAE